MLSLISLSFVGCMSSKKKAELANPKPQWVESRPVDSYYYTGVGIAKKWGSPDNYKGDARNKALADMSAQINSQVSATSVLYQVEDKQGVSEILASNIKSSSKEFLEGYEMVGEWQDETTYCVFYRLSKTTFAELKEKRRQSAVTVAQSKYQSALQQQSANQTAAALLLYAQVLESLNTYLGESNTVTIDGVQIDLATNSLAVIKKLINDLQVVPSVSQLDAVVGQTIGEDKLSFVVTDKLSNKQTNIPIAFTFTGGYLRKDNALSDTEGVVRTAIYQVKNSAPSHLLCAKVDVTNLTRQLTRDLLVRKLIEGTAGNSGCITIQIK